MESNHHGCFHPQGLNLGIEGVFNSISALSGHLRCSEVTQVTDKTVRELSAVFVAGAPNQDESLTAG